MSGKGERDWHTGPWWLRWNRGHKPKWWEWVALAVGLALVAVAVKQIVLGG